jgi:hypothetical protein
MLKFAIRCHRAFPFTADVFYPDAAKPLGSGGESAYELLRRDRWVTVALMGNSKGRDNAKKRARRRKKTERLALAKSKPPSTREATPKAFANEVASQGSQRTE